MNPSRRHDIDALRVLAFGLLIFYHVGMFYVADWGWHVKSAYLSEWLQLPMLLVNQWRMPLLFMISGIAVHFLFGRMTRGAFAWSRTKRLLIPLLFGMAVIVPPQAYFQALTTGAFDGSYAQFLWRYFTFQGWPAGAFDGSDPGITWNHLWYLPYLLIYTLAAIPLLGWLRRANRLRDALRGWKLLALPAVPLFAYGLFVYPIFGDVTHALLDDGYGHAMFFTFFIYGCLLGTDAGLWREIARLRVPVLLLAVCSFAVFLALREFLPENASRLQEEVLFMLVLYLNRWLWLMLVLGFGHALLNRPSAWLGYANEAVYPWYILHQTITVTAGYQLAKLELGPVVEPVLVLGLTIAGCLVLHEFVIRRVAVLRPLFGLKSQKAAGRAPRNTAMQPET